MQDKDYTIKNVQKRDAWQTQYGSTMQPYALQLEGIEGWVEMNQKPETAAPQVGNTLHGHTESVTRGQNTYLKFKKVNPNWDGPADKPNATAMLGNEKTLEYIVTMLEELTGRKPKADNIVTDIDESEPFDLSEIPF